MSDIDYLEWHPTGTVTVRDDDGNEWHLRRVKFGEWRTFSERLQVISDGWADQSERATQIRDELEDAKGKKAETLQAELDELEGRRMYDDTIPWIRDVFERLSDKPLPEDVDEWPAFLAGDPFLPASFVRHWRMAPKASGLNGLRG